MTRFDVVHTTDSSASGTGWSVMRSDDFVELRINGLSAAEGPVSMPSGFAPRAQTYVPVSATPGEGNARVAISTAGVITPQLYSGTAYGFITYKV